jgi:hypothetical protein
VSSLESGDETTILFHTVKLGREGGKTGRRGRDTFMPIVEEYNRRSGNTFFFVGCVSDWIVHDAACLTSSTLSAQGGEGKMREKMDSLNYDNACFHQQV